MHDLEINQNVLLLLMNSQILEDVQAGILKLQCNLDALWGLRDADRMEIRKCYGPTDGAIDACASKNCPTLLATSTMVMHIMHIYMNDESRIKKSKVKTLPWYGSTIFINLSAAANRWTWWRWLSQAVLSALKPYSTVGYDDNQKFRDYAAALALTVISLMVML